MVDTSQLAKRAHKAKVTSMSRHVLICTAGDCETGDKVAKVIKHGIAKARLRADVSVAKTRCMNICKGKGAIVVVYPEGVWYGGVDERLAQRIVDDHLADGREVPEAVFLRNPMAS